MTVAFLGVHRLINKMVHTCSQFSESSTTTRNLTGVVASAVHPAPGQAQSNWPMATGTEQRATIPLKVLRLLDTQSSPLSAGRMVMSGRFADVCAELDRITELQSKQFSLKK